MKKRKVVIATTLFVILNLFLVNTSWAQEIAKLSERENVYPEFLDIILNNGIVGLHIWILIFFFCAICPVLGIVSIISNSILKNRGKTLSTHLLLCCAGMLFVLGLLGSVYGTIDVYMGLASATGAEKAQIMALSISYSLYASAVSLMGCLGYLFFYTVSIIIFYSKNIKIPSPKPPEAL